MIKIKIGFQRLYFVRKKNTEYSSSVQHLLSYTTLKKQWVQVLWGVLKMSKTYYHLETQRTFQEHSWSQTWCVIFSKHSGRENHYQVVKSIISMKIFPKFSRKPRAAFKHPILNILPNGPFPHTQHKTYKRLVIT